MCINIYSYLHAGGCSHNGCGVAKSQKHWYRNDVTFPTGIKLCIENMCGGWFVVQCVHVMVYVSDNLWYTNTQSALSLTTLSLPKVWTGLAPCHPQGWHTSC